MEGNIWQMEQNLCRMQSIVTVKEPAKQQNRIPMDSIISLVIAKEPMVYQYGINCNCKGANELWLVQHLCHLFSFMGLKRLEGIDFVSLDSIRNGRTNNMVYGITYSIKFFSMEYQLISMESHLDQWFNGMLS